RIATRMISTNSGMEIDTDGSVELKGSNETVTKCRLATANTMKIRPSGTTIRVVRNFRIGMPVLDRVWPSHRAPEAGASLSRENLAGFGVVAVQPLAHFLARLEERNAFLVDRHMGAGPWIAPGTGGAMFHRERAKATQLDPVAARQGSHDFI